MKCPDCGATVKFEKSNISCSQCNWQPPPTAQSMYRLAPLTNRQVFLGALCVFVTAGGVIIFSGILWIGIVLSICGLALIPVQFAVRSWAIKKMIDQSEGI